MLQGEFDQITQVCRFYCLKICFWLLSFWGGNMLYVFSIQWSISASSLPDHGNRVRENTYSEFPVLSPFAKLSLNFGGLGEG